MAKTKENHRNKKKTPRTHEELDFSKFNDIVKHKTKPTYKGKERTLLDKEREERGDFKKKHNKQSNKNGHQGRKSNKPKQNNYKPNKKG